jgi:hypothetical protein
MNLDCLKITNEDKFQNEIDKKTFYSILSELKIDLKEIFPEFNQFNKTKKQDFNFLLLKLKSDYKLPIIEALSHIEEDFVNVNHLVSFLDGETLFLLKTELAEKFKIKTETVKNKLKDFLDAK